MPDFGELLTTYTDRAGIGDAELARRIGVNRLTLVRWKEGVTARPRYREDVVRCAEALRLSDEERESLLAAAGFAEPAQAAGSADAGRGSSGLAARGEGRRARRRRLWWAAGAGALVLAGVAAAVGVAAGLSADDAPAVAPGEPLIVLAPFTSYTPGEGYNVHGRLREVIEAELQAAGVANARTEVWAEALEDEAEAQEALARSGAAIVVWGEYDSGRVIARFTTSQGGAPLNGRRVVQIASNPVNLPVTINAELTAEVRHVALATLGELYIEQGEFDLAKPVLIQASVRPPSDRYARANLHSLMGRAYMGGELADLDEAIWLFTRSITVRPSAEAHTNRGLAYLERGREGDAAPAIADLTLALGMDSESTAARLGRATAYIARGAAGDKERALEDLDAAEAIDPSLTEVVERLRGEATLL